jgi:hypothetical protein
LVLAANVLLVLQLCCRTRQLRVRVFSLRRAAFVHDSNSKAAAVAAEARANVLVAGSAIFGAPDPLYG